LQQERLPGGRRVIVSIAEISSEQSTGWVDVQVEVSEIFRFEREGMDAEGQVVGRHLATGYQPHCLEAIRKAGISNQESLEE
jgi:pilus assembly protein CpaF